MYVFVSMSNSALVPIVVGKIEDQAHGHENPVHHIAWLRVPTTLLSFAFEQCACQCLSRGLCGVFLANRSIERRE